MANKIVLTKGSLGNWYCEVESDNGKGDFFVYKVNEDIQFDREELIVKALRYIGIDVEYEVNSGN